MKTILIFGGTSEGRIIAETLSKNGIMVHISVATDYGRQVLEANDRLFILEGRLDADSMESLCHKNNYDFIIDATHPFATAVSENIKKCASKVNLPLIRFERNVKTSISDKIIYAEDPVQCKEILLKTTGKILLTTGSKDLHLFCQNQEIKERLITRVLPGFESLKLCYENGLEGKQIIAMQGPFSEKMNSVQIEDYDISVLVTKESGKTGGTDSKIQAAIEKGIQCIVIKNPSIHTDKNTQCKKYFLCDSIQGVYDCLKDSTGISITSKNKITVDLIGIGMGSKKGMTLEAIEKIESAQCIFGAERMISGINSNAKKYPYYLSKDIIPVLRDLLNSENTIEHACVLFSGDTGFFSGAEKLKNDLSQMENITVNVNPGISSMSYLASKIGIHYQDAKIISLHGTEESFWKPQLTESIKKSEKIFILTSGIEDLHKVSKLILDYNKDCNCGYKIALGFQLSYENEKAEILEPEECLSLKDEGLYSAFLFTE